ncbi:deoxyribose-phosphate aldolase [Paracoccus laeviglucosivorans]|uniref:Deoxyribose-phosphate aldolase n=1 Tax=Paracoccus laeviglucosivorans TaxID=1197861 RepID=A0A521CNC8_9RHOB|nr:deoxyribose-phosphate aldolase [Paracoccus laeviglucosivorans]SMO60964.1 deoxyribose-phosphate aldolase [Paracoccus laeviglucosivorans]
MKDHDSKRRNPGTALHLEWFDRIAVNTPAAERRAASLPARRSLKKEWQAAWLLNAVRCIDLTTLSGDDTPDRVARLCAKARQPIEPALLDALGVEGLTTGAVCVYPTMVAAAKHALRGTDVPVASVATGFPAGLMPLDLRLAEIRYALDQGADEIDIVISRAHVLRGEWSALYDELCAMREACGRVLMKSILATGELKTLTNVARASHVAMQAGSDFIKTSTGKEPVNATLPVSLVMLRAIRDYRDQTGFIVGFKPAGGLRTAKDALNWQVLMAEELGRDWLSPDLFRIGASSLLGDIERQISHHVTGRYAAAHRLAAG